MSWYIWVVNLFIISSYHIYHPTQVDNVQNLFLGIGEPFFSRDRNGLGSPSWCFLHPFSPFLSRLFPPETGRPFEAIHPLIGFATLLLRTHTSWLRMRDGRNSAECRTLLVQASFAGCKEPSGAQIGCRSADLLICGIGHVPTGERVARTPSISCCSSSFSIFLVNCFMFSKLRIL